MHKGKSIARREHMITASSSSSDDDNNVSLGANQEEAPALTHNVVSLRHHNIKVVSLHSGIHTPASIGEVLPNVFFKNQN